MLRQTPTHEVISVDEYHMGWIELLRVQQSDPFWRLCRGSSNCTSPARSTGKGAALRNGDWTYQLYRLLGQPIPRVDDRRSLCVDAGTAAAPGPHGFRSDASLDVTAALPETRSPGSRLDTSHRSALAGVLPISG